MNPDITIYTDASYDLQTKRGAYAALLIQNGQDDIRNILCGICSAENSMSVELIAIEKALSFISIDSTELQSIEIRTDLLQAVNCIRTGKYKVWQEKGWRNSRGMPFNACCKEWKNLIDIYCMFPSESISIKYVGSNSQLCHSFVDKLARNIMKSEHEDGWQCVVELAGVSGFYSYDDTASINIDEKKYEVPRSDSVKSIHYERLKRELKGELNENEIIQLPLKDIVITEKKHLHAGNISFGGYLVEVKKTRTLSSAIVVKPIKKGKYSLTSGLMELFAEKIRGREKVPCIITSLDSSQYMRAKKKKQKKKKESAIRSTQNEN